MDIDKKGGALVLRADHRVFWNCLYIKGAVTRIVPQIILKAQAKFSQRARKPVSTGDTK